MKTIAVPVGHRLVERCMDFGVRVDKHFKGVANKSFSKGSHSRFGGSKTKTLHTNGKISECAVCIFLGLDPFTQLKWTHGQSDGGYDILVNGHTIDVKTSDNPHANRLMWPVKRIHKLPQAADIFVMSLVLDHKRNELGQAVDLIGWTTRDNFIRMHWTAQGQRGIVDGTPYLNQKDLYSMEQLRQHLEHQRHTERKSTHDERN